MQLCRRLECSWAELQAMPEEMVEMWDALLAGEADGQKAAAKARQGSVRDRG